MGHRESTYVELEEDPLLGISGGGPMGAEIGVEDVGGLLGGEFAGHGLDLEGQGLHPRLQLHLHPPPPSPSSELGLGHRTNRPSPILPASFVSFLRYGSERVNKEAR